MSEYLFREMQDEHVVLCKEGRYKQSKVYLRLAPDAPSNNIPDVYCLYGGSYIRLGSRGSTSIPKLRWDFITIMHGIQYDKVGRMYIVDNTPEFEDAQEETRRDAAEWRKTAQKRVDARHRMNGHSKADH